MLDKTNFYLNLGKNIKKLREDKSLSLDKFSEVSGLNLNKSTLSAIENGKQQISAFQLYLIAEALDLKMENLLKGLEVMDEEKDELLTKNDINKLESL